MTGFVLRSHEFHSAMRVEFGHTSAVRDRTQSVLVLALPDAPEFETAAVGIGESCPRDYVTGESTASVLEFLATHRQALESQVATLADLRDWMARHEAEIDRNPAAFAAIEGALIDFLARRQGVTLEEFLGLPPLADRFEYSAVLGDSRPWKFWLQAMLYWLAGFRDFKVKIGGDLGRDRGKFAIFRFLRLLGPIRLRADANNFWSDAPSCIRYLRDLGAPFWAIEEPVGAGDTAAQGEIARALGMKIILDESLLRADQLTGLAGVADCLVANIRISKNGGILRSLALGRDAAAMGIPLIFGAHVGETSVLTRSAMAVANKFPDHLRAQEGGFGRLLLKLDAVSPSLNFRWGGILRPGRVLPEDHSGSGLIVTPAILRSGPVSIPRERKMR